MVVFRFYLKSHGMNFLSVLRNPKSSSRCESAPAIKNAEYSGESVLSVGNSCPSACETNHGVAINTYGLCMGPR